MSRRVRPTAADTQIREELRALRRIRDRKLQDAHLGRVVARKGVLRMGHRALPEIERATEGGTTTT